MGIAQYDIVLVNLDPTVGSEIQKTRPCVVVSPDEMNRWLRTVIIAPMTTTEKKYPTRCRITFQEKKGWIALDQVRTIDRKRIVKTYGKLSSVEIRNVKSILREMLVD